jgi:hypothetical protein
MYIKCVKSGEKPLSELKLKWFDESTLMTDDARQLLGMVLESLGVTSKPGFEVFHVLLEAHKAGLRVGAREVRAQIVKYRMRHGDSDRKGLTLRNIQVWLKYYQDIGFLDNMGDKYMFKAARKPSECFNEYTVPIIEESVSYTRRALEAMQKAYGLE